jgi:hypothetical protein
MSYLLARGAQASGDYPSTSSGQGSEQLTYLLFLKMAEERARGRRGFGQVVRWFSSEWEIKKSAEDLGSQRYEPTN